ncbi:MAG: GNAT family N-acetyltransferase [Crocinitomicaceae bacterium]|nr:GNAT family N-acetyltransferase [Crocinitomicaceae bacterium]|tara:strand:- start:32064 stop:32486 length:423 start_codon:yes stop_codon:yes gene_type:complete
MEIKEIKNLKTMLENFKILKEVYPRLTLKEYKNKLNDMLSNNYKQVGVYNKKECIGLTGYWIGTKLWCDKYFELDNIVISKKYRSKGIGEELFKYMEAKARKEKCSMIALDTYTNNFKAHKFFYNQGYIPKGFHFIKKLK